MKKYVFRQTMDYQTALKEAENKGSWVWNLIFASKPLSTVKLHYVEYILFDMEASGKTSIRNRISSPKKTGEVSSKRTNKSILMLGNGTTASAAVVKDLPEVEEKEFDDDISYQDAEYTYTQMEVNAKKLAVRAVHRLVGGIPKIETIESKSIYRPFWVACYGETSPGSKMRYRAIPADGGKTRRY